MYDLNPAELAILPPGWHADGNGLFLVVTAKGSRSWVVKYSVKGQGGERKPLGLGGLKDVSLKEARHAAEKIRSSARDGIDPKAQRIEAASAPTFGALADELLPTLIMGHKSEKTVAKWNINLKTYAAPIRELPVDKIATKDVLAMLTPHYLRAPSMARELRGRIEKVFSAALALGHRPRELGNPAALRDNLQFLIPKLPPRGKARGPQPSMPYRELPDFFPVMRQSDGIVAKALMLLILTALRTDEVRELVWSEIDFDNAVIRLNSRRMKNSLDAEVPLSAPAIALLRDLKRDATSATLIFPGRKPGLPISSASMLKYLQTGTPKRTDCTVHGFRSSFRSWGQDQSTHSREVLEFCLHHIEGKEAERAYKQGAMLEKRRAALNDWAAFLLPARPTLRVVA